METSIDFSGGKIESATTETERWNISFNINEMCPLCVETCRVQFFAQKMGGEETVAAGRLKTRQLLPAVARLVYLWRDQASADITDAACPLHRLKLPG